MMQRMKLFCLPYRLGLFTAMEAAKGEGGVGKHKPTAVASGDMQMPDVLMEVRMRQLREVRSSISRPCIRRCRGNHERTLDR
jgi:hypothetical protein